LLINLLFMSKSINLKKVLFVCLGNICRSPTAEAVFRKYSEKFSIDFEFDSAGTSANHVGEFSDPRSIHFAEKRGYEMKHRARAITYQDLDHFDLILTMDSSNHANVLKLANGTPEKLSKIQKVTDYCRGPHSGTVPDPYYGIDRDFELVLDLLEDAAEGFFHQFQNPRS
jgi:protein-tyrosine phosphatase